MEIAFVIAILAAFALGAYIRKPFSLRTKEAINPTPPTPPELSSDERREHEEIRKNDAETVRQINDMLSFVGKRQK